MNILNEKQFHPFTIEIEPTEGCNLGCSFCGLRGVKKNGTLPWLDMKFSTLKKVVDDIKKVGWENKIVFAGHGEPTLNKDILKMIKYTRDTLPKNPIYLISNGCGIVHGELSIEKFMRNLKEWNISVILDNYSPKGDWSKIVDTLSVTDIAVELFNKDSKLFDNSKKNRILVYPLEVDNHKGIIRKMSNHCGAAAPLDYSCTAKKCAKPFRELFIRWDGNVALCCDDFRGEYKIENILNMYIEDLWNHEHFQAARIMLYNGDRNFKPCFGCNCISMRVSLLPDYAGQGSLPPIDENIKNIVKNVTKLVNPLSTINKRNWEK